MSKNKKTTGFFLCFLKEKQQTWDFGEIRLFDR